jgi:anti-sigma B factor antagonist
MDQTLIITESGSDGGPSKILKLQGPLLISNMFDFQSKVRSTPAPTLILDLTEVPYMDSAGVGVLVGAHVSRDKDGRKLLLVGVTQRVRQTLQVTQVERFFTFLDTVPEGAGA